MREGERERERERERESQKNILAFIVVKQGTAITIVSRCLYDVNNTFNDYILYVNVIIDSVYTYVSYILNNCDIIYII